MTQTSSVRSRAGRGKGWMLGFLLLFAAALAGTVGYNLMSARPVRMVDIERAIIERLTPPQPLRLPTAPQRQVTPEPAGAPPA